MKKAFAYLRVSGKGQLHGDGFRRQLEAIRTYAKAHDIQIVRVFEERGVSGATDLEHRPALALLMEALHSNGVRVVIIEKLDRIARDLMIQETIVADLRKHGFELVSTCEPDLLADDPTRKLMRQFLGAIAEYEKSMLVLKLRVARARLRERTGRCEGRKAYGFRPGEQEVIDRMKELQATGESFEAIAKALNEEGVKPRAGARWYGSSVNNVLGRANVQRQRN